MSNESLGTVKIEGLSELMKKLDQLPAELIRKVHRSAMKKSLAPTYDAVMRHVPVGETGNLANSVKIKSKVVEANAGGSYMYGMVGAYAPHAHLVELGHRMLNKFKQPTKLDHVPPHPFMLPALLETSDEAVKLLAAELEKSLKKCEVKK